MHTQIKEMITEQAVINMEIIQYGKNSNIYLKITLEFDTLTATELVEIINLDKGLTTLGDFPIQKTPQITIFESSGIAESYICTNHT